MRRRSICVLVRAALAALCIAAPFASPAAEASTLPDWVQVGQSSAALYAHDGDAKASLASLSRSTFLRVLGAGMARLQVEAFDANGDPAQRGWVDPQAVLPSGPGTDWLVTATTTRLWQAAEPDANGVRDLQPFTPLAQVGDADQDRVHVRIYRPDFSAVVDEGWVDAADVGPALPPPMPVAAAAADRPPARGLQAASVDTRQAFLGTLAQAARAGAQRTGVPASVTVAQAILESDWGRSSLAHDANNYFGIKAIGGLGSDGLVWLPTSEVDAAGQPYPTVSAFRAYKNLSDSLTDHNTLLRTAPRYAAAMQATDDPKQFAQLLSEAGYSTDPEYADKLVALMDRYDLYSLDD